MTLHTEVLAATQLAALRQLATAATDAGFYLAGGTAVALHLGHRRSVDFDWFGEQVRVDPEALAARLRASGAAVTIRAIDRGTLHAELSGVAVSFLEYAYPLLEPLVPWPDHGCALASKADLACMKLTAVAARGSRKDFADVYALGRTGLGLSRMLELYQAKFETRDVIHVLASLCYFDDAEAEAMPEMLWPVSWSEIKATLEQWVRAQQS